MVNVGQLARERHGSDDVVIVGFGGHRGGVIAAPRWGAQTERMPPARPGSLEALLHDELGEDSVLVFPRGRGDGPPFLSRRMDHRAIGVVYAPEREAWGDDVPTVLGERYDAFLWFVQTRPLQPLPLEPEGSGEELTWPWAV